MDVVAGAFGSAIPKLRFWDSRGLIVNKGMYFLYFLESRREDGFIYVGVTDDLLRRLKEHNLAAS